MQKILNGYFHAGPATPANIRSVKGGGSVSGFSDRDHRGIGLGQIEYVIGRMPFSISLLAETPGMAF
jgi:hypothetical protein